jgi:hypothetical protein
VLTRASQGLSSGVHANNARPSTDQRSTEAAIAAAKVKHPLPRDYICQQQLAALLKALRQRIGRDRCPNLFVPAGHLKGAAAAQDGRDRLHKDAEVKRQRPTLDVKEVEIYEVIEVQLGATDTCQRPVIPGSTR